MPATALACLHSTALATSCIPIVAIRPLPCLCCEHTGQWWSHFTACAQDSHSHARMLANFRPHSPYIPSCALRQVNTRRDAKYSLKASYLEIYNEGAYDLVHFNPKAKQSLAVKWDASYGFYVQGLKVRVPERT